MVLIFTLQLLHSSLDQLSITLPAASSWGLLLPFLSRVGPKEEEEEADDLVVAGNSPSLVCIIVPSSSSFPSHRVSGQILRLCVKKLNYFSWKLTQWWKLLWTLFRVANPIHFAIRTLGPSSVAKYYSENSRIVAVVVVWRAKSLVLC